MAASRIIPLSGNTGFVFPLVSICQRGSDTRHHQSPHTINEHLWDQFHANHLQYLIKTVKDTSVERCSAYWVWMRHTIIYLLQTNGKLDGEVYLWEIWWLAECLYRWYRWQSLGSVQWSVLSNLRSPLSTNWTSAACSCHGKTRKELGS